MNSREENVTPVEAPPRRTAPQRDVQRKRARSYSVRPRRRRFLRIRKRRTKKQAVTENQFSVRQLLWMVTLCCVALGAFTLGSQDPLGRFIGACAIVTMLATIPKRWWEVSGAVLAVFGALILGLFAWAAAAMIGSIAG